MRAERSLVHPRDDTRPARRTHPGCGKRMCVPHAFPRELIKMRRDGIRVAVTTQMRADVFRRKPKNVRPILGIRCAKQNKNYRDEFFEFFFHR